MNILFICSRNKWRSRTAETIFKNSRSHTVKSAGTANDARIKVTEKLVSWSDIIFVMEQKHHDLMIDKFGDLMRDKNVVVLDIPDDYKYMDKELIELLKSSISPYFE